MATRLTEIQKKEISKFFLEGKTVEILSQKFGCTKLTIIRNLKKNLGELKYSDIVNKNKSSQKKSPVKLKQKTKINNYKKDINSIDNNLDKIKAPDLDQEVKDESFAPSSFIEIAPLNLDIENSPRKEFSSVSISEFDFPKVVYMIVDKQIELEIKLIKDYPEWEFLPKDDLNRKAIEIHYDLKIAKRRCNKEQKVIKVPNTDVFRIVAPILLSRGISRIVSEENLIAL